MTLIAPTSIFEYNDYRLFLNECIHGKDAPRGVQSSLAKYLGCQSSYLYQVLRGNAELTEDQAFKTTVFFRMTREEQSYFLCLVRISKAGSLDLKTYLIQEAGKIKASSLDLKNKADSKEAAFHDEMWDYYFSGDLPSCIHLLTSSSQFQTIETISKKVGQPEEVVAQHLHKLREYKLVEYKNRRWFFEMASVHFSKDSRHNLQMQLMRRTQAMQSLLHRKNTDSHFCSLFTLDRSSYEKLNIMIAKFVESAQKLVHRGGSDDLYILNVDLFNPYSK